MIETRCLVVGGGLAGLSTAFQLVQRGLDDLIVADRELQCGVHSSGRTAGMIRQLVPEPELAELGRQGARFLRGLGDEVFAPVGSLLLADEHGRDGLETQARLAIDAGVPVELLGAEEARRRWPILSGSPFELAAWTPSDGTVNIRALLDIFERGAAQGRGRRLLGCAVRSISRSGGRFVIEVGPHRIASDVIVNAAGAWADGLAEMAGVETKGLEPFRRHVLTARRPESVAADTPFVWNINHEAYLRIDGDRVLASACDHEKDRPGDARAVEEQLESMESVVRSGFPVTSGWDFDDHWAGHRTFAPDRRFVLGPDPKVDGFFWAAALGGHGVTASAAIGDVVASSILEQTAS